MDHIIPNSYFSSNLKTSINLTDISNLFPIFLVTETPDISTYKLTISTLKRYINDKLIKKINLLLNKVNWSTFFKQNAQIKHINQSYIFK